MAMDISLLVILAVAGSSQAHPKLLLSSDVITLQPGEVRSIHVTSNFSKPYNVRLHSRFSYIASVTPQQCDVDPSQPWWTVELQGHQLGYTYVVAAVNVSNSLSFEEGLIKITVLRSHWLDILSQLCGWIYFSAWTFSFYPQILRNMRRKSVVGLNFDFLALNALGYVCYSIYNCCFFFVTSIQTAYFRRHAGATNPVLLNDVLFSLHGFLANTLMIIQVLIYDRGDQNLSKTGLTLLTIGMCTLAGLLGAASHGSVMWLDAVIWISFIKLCVTVTKYFPQAMMNYRKRSTDGWSIEAVMLDLTGSCFSILQMMIISYNCDDWVSILGDPTKFGLGIFSIVFDIVFFTQHFILYRDNGEVSERKEAHKNFYRFLQASMFDIVYVTEKAKRANKL